MHVGNTFIFQNPLGNDGPQSADAGVYETEYKLADRVEGLGFDSLWGVEHHFNGYAMCPDPLKFLTYFAGRTSRVKLGTMVCVAPWHDAIRLAEDSSVLDIVSGGRNILGIGRGVAKLEFDSFRLDMNKSRQTLIEHTEATMMGLEKGYIDYSGEVLQQPYALIRPGPVRSFRNRVYASASSPESYPIMAKLGVGLLFIPGTKSWDAVATDLDVYHRTFEEAHGRPAPRPIFAGWVFCDEDAGRARDLGRHYIDTYIRSALGHYQMSGEHMRDLKGYESYWKEQQARMAAGVTQNNVVSQFVENHIYGTPDACFEKVVEVQKKLGACGFLGVFNYSGMSFDEAARNQALFAQKVLPRLQAYEAHLDIGAESQLEAA